MGPYSLQIQPLVDGSTRFLSLYIVSLEPMDHWLSGLHLGEKLNMVKETLKSWAKTSSSSIQNTIKEKKIQLENIQGEMETKEVQQSHIMLEQKMHKEYIQALKEEEITWRLKSRSLWMKEGDQNTSFFHRQTKARHWTNQISEIKTQTGEIIKEFDQIKKKTSSHFLKLYTSDRRSEEVSTNSLLNHIPRKISEEDNHKLNRQIEEK
jgi:hypothetical protein